METEERSREKESRDKREGNENQENERKRKNRKEDKTMRNSNNNTRHLEKKSLTSCFKRISNDWLSFSQLKPKQAKPRNQSTVLLVVLLFFFFCFVAHGFYSASWFVSCFK